MRESGGTPVREILLRREERVAQTEDFRYNPWRGHSFVWIYIVDMHFHILADVFYFDNMNYSSKLFNPTSFVIEPKIFIYDFDGFDDAVFAQEENADVSF